MRALIIPMAVLTVLLLLSLWTGSHVAERTAVWQDALRQADDLAEEERWEEARSQLRRTYGSWEESQLLFHTILKHDGLDQAEALFAGAFAACDQRDVPDFHAALGELDTELSLLREEQRLSIRNIL